MNKKYKWQSSGHKCTCSECETDIEDHEPRYVPTTLEPGRLCVKCHGKKVRPWANKIVKTGLTIEDVFDSIRTTR